MNDMNGVGEQTSTTKEKKTERKRGRLSKGRG